MDFGGPDRPEVRKTGQHTLDMVTSICALGISAVSIFMAWDNGHDMQKLVHASSWPAVELGSGNRDGQGGSSLSFGLKNAGIGPARLHTFAFFVDGEAVHAEYTMAALAERCCSAEWKSALQRTGGDVRRAMGGDISRPIAHSFLSPHEDATALRWPRTDENQTLWNAVDQARQRGRITMRVCYCSVFDECWIADPHSFPPPSVASCPKSF
jgi:hypothetical protein